jgi:hypothetical protein
MCQQHIMARSAGFWEHDRVWPGCRQGYCFFFVDADVLPEQPGGPSSKAKSLFLA